MFEFFKKTLEIFQTAELSVKISVELKSFHKHKEILYT